MRTTALLFCFCLSLIGLTACDMPEGADTNVDADSRDTAADNTGINDRDADGDTMTPLDQGQSQADVDRTAEIRRKVLETENMSVNARNVKIITNDGKVTLRGPVDSADEKSAIERIAVGVAGDGNVTNQIEIAAGE